MNRPIAFRCEYQECELERLKSGNILLKLNHDAELHHNGTVISLGHVFTVIYDTMSDSIYADGHTTIDMHIPNHYVNVYKNDSKNIVVLEIKEFGPEVEYPMFRTEIKGDVTNSYIKPDMISDEILFMSLNHKDYNKHMELVDLVKPLLSQLFSDMYNNDRSYYLYYNDAIYRVDNIGPNCIYATLIDIYDMGESTDTIIPLVNIAKSQFYLFDSDMTIVYDDAIIRDGIVRGQYRDLWSLIGYSRSEFNESVLYSIHNTIANIESMTNVLQDAIDNNGNYIEIIEYVRSSIIDLEEKYNNVIDSDELSKLSIEDLFIIINGKMYTFSKESISNYISTIKQLLDYSDNIDNQ